MGYKNLDEETRENILHIASERQDIILLDMSWHLYRFFYVHQDLSVNVNGFPIPTGHIYGFLKMIAYLKRNMTKPAIIICVDGKDPEKIALNEGYKGSRDEERYNVHGSTKDILNMCSLMKNVYVSYNELKEADETIYAVATNLDTLFQKNGMDKRIYIYGNDKDLWQAINERISVVKKFGSGYKNFLKGAEIVDINKVREEFGVEPKDLAKYRAIIGDTSDNLAGYPRFLKKNAAFIAENCVFSGIDVNVAGGGVAHPLEGSLSESLKKGIKQINENYNLFLTNYRIMKLRDYDFSIKTLKCYPEDAWNLIAKYEMNQYAKEVELLGEK